MLQARQLICILLLAACVAPEGYLHAQSDELTVNPQDTLTRQAIEADLAAAATAMQEGRLDQPPNDCALFYYRAVLKTEPENLEAQQGLVELQRILVSRAIDVARSMDFESANRMLDDAAQVRSSPELIDAGREQIEAVKEQTVAAISMRAERAIADGDFAMARRQLIELIAMGDSSGTVNQIRRKLDEAEFYGGSKPGEIIRDRFLDQENWAPETVVIKAGSFIMGSSELEEGRSDSEGPTHRVTFHQGFAIGRTEVTVKEFRRFVAATGYKTDADRQRYSMVYNHRSGRLVRRDGTTWRMNYEGQEASDDEPVVHVSWNDAAAFGEWLSRETGKAYRLPSEAEFEYVVRSGQSSRYWWGEGTPSNAVENLTGEDDFSPRKRQWSSFFSDYQDGFWGPAPVASFAANPLGVHDMAGNVGEWVLDCWHATFRRAPVDGSAWLNPGCKLRTVRGGFWASSPDQARSAFRQAARPDRRDALIGFRIARDL